MVGKTAKNRYMLIDGNALIHRGYHAVPGLTNKAGEPTGAVYGFVSILLRAIKDLKPTHIACSFDLAGPTFRHEEYAEYKGTRVKADQELYDQIPKVKDVVRGLNIPIFEVKGFEADDVLGTLATEISKGNGHSCDVMIVTGDMDTLQLVNKCVKIYTLRKGITDTAVYDEEAIINRFGLTASQMIDYKALRGDPSDNIKGVRGIGEKGAIDLLKQFHSIDNLYKAIHADQVGDKIKPRILGLLTDQEESARQSYRLATIVTNVPLEIEIPAYEFTQKYLTQVTEIFKELEFKSLLDKLPRNYLGLVEKPTAKKIDTADELSVSSRATTRDPEPMHSAVLDSGSQLRQGFVGQAEAGMTPSAKFKQDYQLIDTPAKLEKVIKDLGKAKIIALDTESTSLNIIDADLVGLSLAVKEGMAYYIPADLVQSNSELKNILESNLSKIGHNIKYDYLILQNADVVISGIGFDTMIASYLLNAGTRQHKLDTLAFNELGYQMQPIEDLIGKGKTAITMDQVPVEKVSWYAAEDVDMTLRLKNVYEPQLKEEGLDTLFRDIEMPLIPVLASMERTGIKVDVSLLKEMSAEAEKSIYALEKEIYKLADGEFNINSPKQLKEILFDKLSLSSVGNKKTKTGLSTAAGELEKMLGTHPIIEKIMEYRELSKLQSTYLLALPDLVNKKTGRIHTNYNQTIAATGRLSSVDPNLQNIPVRSNRLGLEVRQAFVAEKGYKLLSLDYSQIELRIVAHLAQDERMLEIFKSGEDIHASTAMEIFGVAADKITKDMRRHAKTINFGILYGLSAFGLSYRIQEFAHVDAKEYIEKYFKAYPQVKEYIDGVKREVNEQGFVANELGRKRKFPEIKSSQYFIRQAAERAAINFPIQSLAADVIKVAMINIYKELNPTPLALSPDIRMLLQVHDELVFEVKEDKVEHYTNLIKPLMENAIKLSIPISVEAKVGDNWGEMEKLN